MYRQHANQELRGESSALEATKCVCRSDGESVSVLPGLLRNEPSTSKRKPTVLVLEHDRAFQSTVRDFLAEHSFEVATASDGIEGLDAVLHCDFDVVVCEIHMPTLRGDLFYRTVMKLKLQLRDRFVFLTGQVGAHKAAELARDVGGMVLPMPFQEGDLLDCAALIEIRNLIYARPA